MQSSSSDADFLPLPRVDASTLTYKQFLTDFALPQQPCILTNIGGTWAARTWTVDYMLAHDGVDESHKVHMARGLPGDARELRTTVGKALRKVASVAAADGEIGSRGDDDDGAEEEDGPPKPCYLSAWDYVRGNSCALQEDFEVPRFFERAPAWLRAHVVLGNAATDMKWLYIGTRGSGSKTHIDTNLSSAWLWVARGTKEWVCAHGGDYAQLTKGAGAAAYGYASDGGEGDSSSDADGGGEDGEDGVSRRRGLPDLFAPDLFTRWPHAKGCRLYRGVQRAGEVCYNPSKCVHAVRNIGDGPGSVMLSLTHNFVDATNLPEVLSDATRSLTEELLPMTKELSPKKVLKTLSKALHMPPDDLADVLAALPELLSEANLEELIACAAAGAEADVARARRKEEEAEEATAAGARAQEDSSAAEGTVHAPSAAAANDDDDDVSPAAVAALLRRTLDERLRDVRAPFERAARALRDALKLEPLPAPPPPVVADEGETEGASKDEEVVEVA